MLLSVQMNTQCLKVLNSFFHSCFNSAFPPLSTEDLVTSDPTDFPEELLCSEEEVFDLLLALDTTKIIKWSQW